MELDFSLPWSIIPADPSLPPGAAFPAPEGAGDPAAFAASELAAVLARMTGTAPLAGSGSEEARIICLHAGPSRRPGPDGLPPRSPSSFSWRASTERVEIYGEDGAGLVRGVYDFLEALGARWVEPGAEGERLPTGTRLGLAAAARRSPDAEAAATLILGHGAYLDRWRDYLPWAARAGYSWVFIHTTPDALALAAVPAALYEGLREGIAAEARRRGLGLELGGHFLSSYLPRAAFRDEPELFRSKEGRRSPDANFCVSSLSALETVSRNFSAFAAAHPEATVFHAWPDDLPGGGWCSCPACSSLSPAAQSLRAARALASALARSRPDARLSFLAYHDTEGAAGLDLSGLPPNLELLWAPRRRCWAHGLGEPGCALNAASLGAYRASATAWKAAGHGGTSIFEYWEDAILFKLAVPPLAGTMAGDLSAYAGADAVGILLTGSRPPLAPRPNQWLLPRLLRRASAAAGGSDAEAAGPGAPRDGAAAELADWIGAAYGPASGPMARYWAALEAAWAIELALAPADESASAGANGGIDPDDPPTDWGDPVRAGPERLAERLGRCEELFDRLREAEAALDEALSLAAAAGDEAWARAVCAESREYAIAGNRLELACARLAAYRERASGQAKAAADLALLARAPYAALSRALASVPDGLSRREARFFLRLSFGLRLDAIRREARRNPLTKLFGKAAALLPLASGALFLRRARDRPRS